MIKETKGYSYNDLTILPAFISDVSSRSECDVYDNNGMLPIFASPMASVVNVKNYDVFKDNKIYSIIPRNIDINDRFSAMLEGKWIALSLREFEFYFIDTTDKRLANYNGICRICVDIANGHMRSLYEKCWKAKNKAKSYNYKLIIMTGNIANPQTYEWICKFNYDNNDKIIDYIRVGIGGGSGCLTTSNTSIHMPQATLIEECYKIKYFHEYNKDVYPYIVADGGIRNYDHVIKALALGADYAMIGGLFAQMVESAGDKYMVSNYMVGNTLKKSYQYIDLSIYSDFKVDNNNLITMKDKNNEQISHFIDVKFFGMASADGQKSISGEKTKTAEGITKFLPVKYTLKGWIKNMISYLQSAMSYTNCKTLNSFIGSPELIINSISEIHAVNK